MNRAILRPRFDSLERPFLNARVDEKAFADQLVVGEAAFLGKTMRIHRPTRLRSENELGGPVANALLYSLFAIEARVLDRVDLPIGVSLACVARKRG